MKGLGIFLLVLAFAVGIVAIVSTYPKLVRTSESPDGRFQVLAYRRPSIGDLIGFPGGGSDVPGEIQLVRVTDHSVLQRERVPAMYLVEVIKWTKDEVSIPPVATWQFAPVDALPQ